MIVCNIDFLQQPHVLLTQMVVINKYESLSTSLFLKKGQNNGDFKILQIWKILIFTKILDSYFYKNPKLLKNKIKKIRMSMSTSQGLSIIEMKN